MAIPKKGLRKLALDGTRFGWLIRSKPTYDQGLGAPMTLAIQEIECSTPKVLQVTLNIDRPDNWMQEHQSQITPKVIKEIISGAMISGWECDAGGSAFEYQHSVVKHM